MRRNLLGLFLALALLAIASPMAMAQNLVGDVVRRGKNGVNIAGTKVTLFDGPGILNYEYKHRWMPGPSGAVTVIGGGAGGGALVGTLVSKHDRKKGALIGAAAGGGAATVVWLYKNRTEKRKIF